VKNSSRVAAPKVLKTIKLFIGGEFPRTESGRTLPVLRTDGSVFAQICRASRKDLRNAVTAAKEAQPGWEKKTAYNRSQILYRMAEMMEGKRAEFIEVLTSVAGYTDERAHEAVDEGIDGFVYYAGFADKYQQLMGTINPVAGPHHNFTTPEPVGVVAALFGSELDLGALTARLSAILCSGNSVVALLPEQGSALLAPLAEVLATSDLPKGVVNLLTGSVGELWRQFGEHMEIQSLSYDGKDSEILTGLDRLVCGNMKRFVRAGGESLSLSPLLSFVEFKTVWHPSGF
jgi:acyl-CoA reductase-like NAD-dependent aldehyde dehydrogenase